MLMNRNWAQALLMLLIMLMATAAVAADEITNWSTIKSQYHSAPGSGTQSMNKPTLQAASDSYPTLSTAEPDRFALQLQDGYWVSITDLLNLVHDNTPDHPFWSNSGYTEWRARDFQNIDTSDISDRWSFGDFWKWIKDHISFSISGFGVNIQLVGSGLTDCLYFNWNWFNNSVEFGPC